MSVAAVVIGRNEGARLIACLEALKGDVAQVIYVDSGSSDGSVEAAQERGAQVIALDMSKPFTAARARNEGIRAVDQGVDYIQFLDGDCALRDGWIATATTYLDAHPKVAVVCGRRRERHPEASVYNQLIDAEWDTPVGEAKACGGDALMRSDAIR
jgi:glycosyltransferase involved in cell wall biosynthesis